MGGVQKVFYNLCLGLSRSGHPYEVNLPFGELRPTDRVGIIGVGPECLVGYTAKNPIVAGVAVIEHPSQQPDLFDRYPVSKVVVHSSWVSDIFERHYGPRIALWQVGIDTKHWSPAETAKRTDFLIYDKIRWSHDQIYTSMVARISALLSRKGLTTKTIRYGDYDEKSYRAALSDARAMIFLCEHESQGIAYQEAMAYGVPVLAWDPGSWLDPDRFEFGEPNARATSVPFFDERCGRTFQSLEDFENALESFLGASDKGLLRPREYVLENLTLERCAESYLNILSEANA